MADRHKGLVPAVDESVDASDNEPRKRVLVNGGETGDEDGRSEACGRASGRQRWAIVLRANRMSVHVS